MILALIVWLVMTVFPLLSGMAWFLFAFGIIWAFVFGFIRMVADDVREANLVAFCKRRLNQKVWKVALVFSFIFALVPSKETSWYMVGAYATQTVAETAVQSETVKELAGDGVDVLKSLMKKAKTYIDEEQHEAPKAEQPKKEST